jgi:glycine/D-amino acid oxidase-like deaminating enzyme
VSEARQDLVIVGGGIMGLFTAYYASRAGSTVTILERSRIGDPQTASFCLTRSIRNDYLDPLYARLAYASRQLWLDLQVESGEQFVIDCGCLNLARERVTPELDRTYAEQSFRILQALGLKAEAFDRDGLRRRFPQFDADLGRLDVEAGYLLVPAITRALRSALGKQQATIVEGVTVEGIAERDGRVLVATSQGEWDARSLVLTVGLGTNDLLARVDGCNLEFPLRPDRPSQTKYLIPPPEQRALFTAPALPVFAYLDIGVYGHPMVPGVTPGVKIGYYNPPDVRKAETFIGDIRGFIDECMPSLREAEALDVKEVDQCSYDLVADDHFILGSLPGFSRILVGVGWRGTGYKFGPLVGRTLMQLALEGRTDYELDGFSPARFVSAHAS